MRTLAAILCILAPACSVQCWGPARADEPARVDAGQLCSVQNRIRWRERAWTADECQRIATALNATREPRRMAAIAINESDLRERAINVVRPGVYDLGLMGVRCVTLGAVAEETGSSLATTEATTTTTIPRDRCTNGAARGIYAHQLLDPTVNIRTAVAVLASHGGSLRGYSGSTKERGYGARIMALVAAFGGELRIPKGAHGRQWARIRELARRIVEAIGKERRS